MIIFFMLKKFLFQFLYCYQKIQHTVVHLAMNYCFVSEHNYYLQKSKKIVVKISEYNEEKCHFLHSKKVFLCF